jgi:hypothetical protein
MPRKKTSRKTAIQAAQGQLGWQASGKEVVALLATYGINVSEGLVNKVKVQTLKRSDEVKRHEKKLKGVVKRRTRPLTQKKPQQRTYRR